MSHSTCPDTWRGFDRVIIGVGCVDEALALWRDQLGLDVVLRSDGPDDGLAALWGLKKHRVIDQAVLQTPGESAGRVHMVQFDPRPHSVRDGANAFDRCPKNLDIHARDLPQRMGELRAGGGRFHTQQCTTTTAPDGTRFREVHMPIHDDINAVLLEVLDEPMPFSSKGYAGVSPLITVVADADAEKAFYTDVLGLTCQSDHVLGGEEIERMIGLPPGTSLDVSIWGNDDAILGALEIVCYRGVSGRNLFSRARPPARGILRMALTTTSLTDWCSHLGAHRIAFNYHGTVTTALGEVSALSFTTPGGLVIEVHETVTT